MPKIDLFTWLAGPSGTAFLAGAAGGIVRWITLRSDWREGAGAMVVGTICAMYLGPLAVPALLPVFGAISLGDRAVEFSSFVTGVAGMSLSGIIINIFNRKESDTSEDEQ